MYQTSHTTKYQLFDVIWLDLFGIILSTPCGVMLSFTTYTSSVQSDVYYMGPENLNNNFFIKMSNKYYL